MSHLTALMGSCDFEVGKTVAIASWADNQAGRWQTGELAGVRLSGHREKRNRPEGRFRNGVDGLFEHDGFGRDRLAVDGEAVEVGATGNAAA